MHKAVHYRIEAFESYTLYIQKQFLAAEDVCSIQRCTTKIISEGKIFRPSLQYAHNKMNV